MKINSSVHTIYIYNNTKQSLNIITPRHLKVSWGHHRSKSVMATSHKGSLL